MRDRFILVFLLCFMFLSYQAQALDISVSGSWSLTINANDLIYGAGSKLRSDYESVSDAVSINISGATSDGDRWQVDVSKSDTHWSSSFILYIKRTSDGVGSGSVSGGTSYQGITEGNQSFFSGSGNRNGITAQLKLSGMSLQIPPDTYTTTIYYTVVDITD